jgi:hypothetical protein
MSYKYTVGLLQELQLRNKVHEITEYHRSKYLYCLRDYPMS